MDAATKPHERRKDMEDIPAQAIAEAKAHGTFEIQDGVWLCTAD